MDKIKKVIHKWSWVLLVVYCVAGIVYPIVGIAALICMLAPSVTAIFKGRMWCGTFCPRGSFNDVLLSKISMKKSAPGFMKTAWFRLMFFAVLMGAFAVQIAFAGTNFIDVSFVFVRMIIITTLLTIILGAIYNHRTWCMVCPMGTMAHYVARLQIVRSKFRHIVFNKEKCVDCKICSKNCPVGIDVLSHKAAGKVTHADCLKCKMCVEKCPKKSLYVA